MQLRPRFEIEGQGTASIALSGYYTGWRCLAAVIDVLRVRVPYTFVFDSGSYTGLNNARALTRNMIDIARIASGYYNEDGSNYNPSSS